MYIDAIPLQYLKTLGTDNLIYNHKAHHKLLWSRYKVKHNTNLLLFNENVNGTTKCISNLSLYIKCRDMHRDMRCYSHIMYIHFFQLLFDKIPSNTIEMNRPWWMKFYLWLHSSNPLILQSMISQWMNHYKCLLIYALSMFECLCICTYISHNSFGALSTLQFLRNGRH